MEYNETKYDWEEVVKLNPKGDFEYQNQDTIVRGPIKSLTVGENNIVNVKLVWAVEMPALGQEGFGTWKVSGKKIFLFPNMAVPYVIETTPEKGDRIRFRTTILYLERLESVNTFQARIQQLLLHCFC